MGSSWTVVWWAQWIAEGQFPKEKWFYHQQAGRWEGQGSPFSCDEQCPALTFLLPSAPSAASSARAKTQWIQPPAQPPGQVPQCLPAQRATHATQCHLPGVLPAASVSCTPSLAQPRVLAIPLLSQLPPLPRKSFWARVSISTLRSVRAMVYGKIWGIRTQSYDL